VRYQELIDEILRFETENEDFLLSGKFQGFHFYPLIRFQVLSEIARKLKNLEEAHANRKNVDNWKSAMFKSLVEGIFKYNPFYVKNRSAVVISSAALRRRKVNGKHYDVIYDPLLDLLENSFIVIENGFHGSHKLPFYTRSLVFSEPIKFLAKLQRVPKEEILETLSVKYVTEVGLRVSQAFPIIMLNTNHLKRSIISSFRYSRSLLKVIKRINPKILFVHCGSYGGGNAIVIKACKNFGITTAEFQHGYVGKYHLAYNYLINDNRYADYLPDYFLTFGQYWSDQLTRYPNKKIVVGNPELSYQVKFCTNIKQKNEILVISQGIVTHRMVELTKELRKRLPKSFTVVFRLHPGEVLFEDRYRSLYDLDGVIVDKDSNIFDLLKRSRVIVGFTSTTLFEALAFEKPIYVMKSSISDAHIPKEVGRRFENAEDLTEMIMKSHEDNEQVDWQYYWELNWKPKLRNFLVEIGLE